MRESVTLPGVDVRTWIATLATMLAVAAALIVVPQATALPLAPEPVVAPVTGIPAPCASTHPFPEDASVDEIREQFSEKFGFSTAGPQWVKENRSSIKILWQSFDAMECTGFRKDLLRKVDGKVGVNAASISGYAWGDWSLTKPGHVSLDFTKFKRALDSGDEGRLVRLVAHEFGHTLNSDRYSNPKYWRDFQALFAKQGKFSDYAGSSVTETFADAIGYYVGRCALDNPYDTGRHDAYYEFVKDRVFGGKEFGPEPGTKPKCTVPDEEAEAPMPGPEWLKGLNGD